MGALCKMKNITKKEIVQDQTKEKKKMLLKMKKEIKKLENEIKYHNVYNIRIYTLKGIKIILRKGQLVAPYIMTAGLVTSICTLILGTPIHRDKIKQNQRIMKEIDNIGNIRYEQQYEDYENSNNIISYFSNWELEKDNWYSRNIEIYSLDDITEEEIIKLINKDIKSLCEILGEPISQKKEIKKDLTEEEINSKPLLRAMIYSINDNDFIMVEEPIIYNVYSTLLYIILIIISEALTFYYRKDISNFDYNNCIEEIKRKYSPIDIKTLNKKIEIKRSNYDKLTR